MVNQRGSANPRLVDKVLWAIVIALIIGVGVGNYYFKNHSLLLRMLGLLAGGGITIAIALQTAVGQKLWTQWLEAIQEVRRMHWPTRQETVQTTFAVFAMVCIMGVLLWTADFMLLRAVKWLTGHWGA